MTVETDIPAPITAPIDILFVNAIAAMALKYECSQRTSKIRPLRNWNGVLYITKKAFREQRIKRLTLHGLDTHGHTEDDTRNNIPNTSKDQTGRQVDLTCKRKRQEDGQECAQISERSGQLAQTNTRLERGQTFLDVLLDSCAVGGVLLSNRGGGGGWKDFCHFERGREEEEREREGVKEKTTEERSEEEELKKGERYSTFILAKETSKRKKALSLALFSCRHFRGVL